MAIFVTDDKWILNHGKLDPVDIEIMAGAAEGGEATVMSTQEALDAMRKQEPGKYKEFLDTFAKLHKVDGSAPLTAEEVIKLGQQADERMKAFDRIFASFLNQGTALLIRQLRVDEHFTWRSIARRAHGTTFWCEWDPPSNQLVGMSLCQAAAKLLGEDYFQDPWN